VLTSLIRFVFISILFSSTAVFSADNASISTEPRASQVAPQPMSNTQLPEWFYRELTSIRKDVSVLDATGASKEQIQELKERIGKVEVRLEETQLRVDDQLMAQGKYVEAINASTDRFGTLASILGLVASIIAVMFGWISAGKKAKSEAKKHVDDWLESNKNDLDMQLDSVKNQLNDTINNEISSAKDQLKKFVLSSKKEIDDIKSEVDKLKNSLIEDVISEIRSENQDNIAKGSMHNVAFEEQHAPDNVHIDANELRSLAMEAFVNKDFEGALELIVKVFGRNNVKDELSDQKMASLLFLKGLTLMKLNRPREAISDYDEIISRYKDQGELALQEKVADALYFKGIVLDQPDLYEQSIEVFDQIIESYQYREEIFFQELVSSAMNFKGIRLRQLGRIEDAIVVYDELIEQFQNRDEKVLEKLVIEALSVKADLEKLLKITLDP
jgi:tetratricopeptide (TPR) repeat protein